MTTGEHQLTREQSDEALQRFTDGFLSGLRAPVLHWPSEVGLEYEDVTFPPATACRWRAGSSPLRGQRS